MNEEIEYAEMLEIPVSTVNVVRKKRKNKKEKTQTQPSHELWAEEKKSDLKESVISQVNGKLNDTEKNEITAESDLFAESANSSGSIDFNGFPDRVDTVRIFSENDRAFTSDGDFDSENAFRDFSENFENEGGRYAFTNETRAEKRVKIALGVEFGVICALCGGIFLTNVFMPNSAINTFFRAIDNQPLQTQTDTRTYSDFSLSGVVSDYSGATLTLSPAGVLSIESACHIYPVADGKVAEIAENADGSYSVKVAYSDLFSGIVNGLEQVYYSVGDEVKSNVPIGYANGEKEVQVTMYSQGVLLDCFELKENELAWVEEE